MGEGIVFSDQKDVVLEEGKTTTIKLSPRNLDLLRSIPTPITNFLIIILLWIIFGFIDWETYQIKEQKRNIKISK